MTLLAACCEIDITRCTTVNQSPEPLFGATHMSTHRDQLLRGIEVDRTIDVCGIIFHARWKDTPFFSPALRRSPPSRQLIDWDKELTKQIDR